MQASKIKAVLPVAALAALALLGACASPFEARVQSFQTMPPAQGQTFSIQPAPTQAGAQAVGSLEFSSYAAMVAQQMQMNGFRPVDAGAEAELKVLMDFGIGPSHERLATRPATTTHMGWGWGAPGWGRGWYGRGPGWWGYDPFWGASAWSQPEVYSFAVYPAFLQVQIVRSKDQTSLFEGRAESTVRSGDLPSVMPNLVTALFKDFPGPNARSTVVRVPQS